MRRSVVITGSVIVCLVIFNAITNPAFLQVGWQDGHLYGSTIDILVRAAPTGLIALGMTLVIATAGVDLSVGATLAIAAAFFAQRVESQPFGIAVLAALALALVCGVFNGVLVAYARIQPIIATLILMVAGRGIAQLIAQGQIITLSDEQIAPLKMSPLGLPMPIVFFAAGAILCFLITYKTRLGSFVEAIGSNAVASRICGVPERRILIIIYALTALLAGAAGLIQVADIKAADANNAGLYFELDAILAVALGGTSLAGGRMNLAGTLLGSLLMQTLTTTLLGRGVPSAWMLVAKALIVTTVVVAQSGIGHMNIVSRRVQ